MSMSFRPATLLVGVVALLGLVTPTAIRAAGFSDFAVYATGTGCGAITLSGNAYTDSFDSSQGSYQQTKKAAKGNLGVAGNAVPDLYQTAHRPVSGYAG